MECIYDWQIGLLLIVLMIGDVLLLCMYGVICANMVDMGYGIVTSWH